MEVNDMAMDFNNITSTSAAPAQTQPAPAPAPAPAQHSAPSANQAEAVAAAAAAQNAISLHTQVAIEGGDGKENTDGKDKNGLTMAQKIDAALAEANKKAVSGKTTAQFKYHEKTKRISIKIMDKETHEVIREIPPEETLDMISKIWELAGLMVDERG